MTRYLKQSIYLLVAMGTFFVTQKTPASIDYSFKATCFKCSCGTSCSTITKDSEHSPSAVLASSFKTDNSSKEISDSSFELPSLPPLKLFLSAIKAQAPPTLSL